MEYELSFVNFDYDEIIKNLKKVKANKKHDLVPFQVAYFNLAGEKDFKKGFVRIREENGFVTLTTKITDSKYPQEYETIVNSSYDDTKKIIINSGLSLKIDTIKFREKWEVKGCHEVVFDLWPGLPLMMEVDCNTEKGLIDLCKKLELNIKDGFTESKYTNMYGFKPEVTQKIPDLNFKNFRKKIKQYIITNKSIFNTLNSKYYKKYISKKYHKYL